MPRVPVIEEVFVPAPRPGIPIAAVAARGIAVLADEVFGLATQQLAADFERTYQAERFELERTANDLRLQAEEDPDPLGATGRFEQAFEAASSERIAQVDNPRVREALEGQLPAILEPRRVSLAATSQRRFRAMGIATIEDQVVPGYIQAAAGAQNDVELELTMRAMADAIMGSPFHAPQEKAVLLQSARVDAQTGRVLRVVEDARESKSLDGFDLARSIVDDDDAVSALDPSQRLRLRNAIDSERSQTVEEVTRGLRLDLFDSIGSARSNAQLDAVRGRIDGLVSRGLLNESTALSFAGQIETRRDAIQGEVISLARVSSSLQTGIPMDRTDPGSREAVDVWYQLAVSSEPDPETAERKLDELVTATQIIPGPVISDLRRGASSSDPGLVAAASTQFESLRQSAPVAAAEQMKGPEFRLLRQMDDALAANEQPGPTLERLRASRQQPESVLKLRREQLRVQRQEETDAEWLDGNSEVLAQEVPGWFNNLNPRDGFPPEFQARYSQLVEEMYLESDDLPFARKSALERMGVTWGVTGVGGNRGLIVPLAPERVYRLQTSEIENELLEDLIREGTLGQDGLRLAALVGEGLVEQTEEGRRALLARVLLRTDLESAREIDPETGSFAPRYSVYVTDEEGRNPEMVWTPEGLPFRFSPTRAAIDAAGDPERIEAARVSHRALTDRLGARTDDPAVPEMLVERGFPLGALRVP